jgi:hypothetical protein
MKEKLSGWKQEKLSIFDLRLRGIGEASPTLRFF